MTDTPLDLDAIEAYCAAATEGPWQIARYAHGGGRIYTEDANSRHLVCDAYMEGDREFLLAARTDLPAVVAALRDALAEVERLNTVIRVQATGNLAQSDAAFRVALAAADDDMRPQGNVMSTKEFLDMLDHPDAMRSSATEDTGAES